MPSLDLNNEATDQELLTAYVHSGDNQVLAQLFTRYTHLVLGVCLKYLKNKEESEDAVVQIYEQLQATLLKSDVQNFAPWLHRVTQNHCLMQLRKAKSLAKKHADFEKDVRTDMENTSELHLEEKDTDSLKMEKLPEALAALPPEQKQCIELFFFEEKSYQEVATLTGYNLKAVKSHLQNGKRNLKKLLSQLALSLLACYQFLLP